MLLSGRRLVTLVLAAAGLTGAAYWGYDYLTKVQPTFANLRYSDQSDRNVLDLYLPDAGDGQFPLVLWVHGGAFMMGDKSAPQSLETLLGAGYAVASINYRLSGEAIWPAQLNDVVAAYSYVQEEAERLKVDPDEIALFGASAGGFLVTTAGLALTAEGRPPVAVVDWFGPVQFSTMDADIEDTLAGTGLERATGRNDAADSPESALIGATVAENKGIADAMSPLAMLAGLPQGATLPPFLIMHGGKDTFVSFRQSERLREALEAHPARSEVEFELLPEAGHGTGDFQTLAASQRVVDFLNKVVTRGQQ